MIVPAFVALGVLLIALRHGGFDASLRSGVAIVALWALVLGFGLGIWPRAPIGRQAGIVGAAIAAFALLTGASILWASSAELALWEFDRVVLYLAAYLIAVVAVPRRAVDRVVDGLAVGICGVVVLSLAGRFFAELAPSQRSSLVPALASRLSYPLGYWNGLAILAALALPLLLRTACRDPRRPVALVALGVSPLIASVIVLASSRGGAVVAAVSMLAFLLFARDRATALAAVAAASVGAVAAFAVLQARPALLEKPALAAAESQGRSAALLIALIAVATPFLFIGLRRVLAWAHAHEPGGKARWIGAAAVIVLLVVGIALTDPAGKVDAFTSVPDLSASRDPGYVQEHLLSSTGSGRWQLWGAAVDQLRANPLLGGGAGSFAAWWAERRPFALTARDAHSFYLESAGELGLLGLFAVGGLVGVVAWAVRGRLRSRTGDGLTEAALAALLVAFGVALAIDWMWEMTVVALLGFVCIGLLVGPATGGAELRLASERRGRARLGLGLAGLLAVWTLIVVQTLPFLAEARLRDSVQAAERGDLVAAHDAALDARALEPWAARPYLQLALIEERNRQLELASRRIGAAIERAPDDWQLRLIATRIAARRGDTAEARRQALKARDLNPRSSLLDSAEITRFLRLER